jgi:hypothetical protein
MLCIQNKGRNTYYPKTSAYSHGDHTVNAKKMNPHVFNGQG